MTWVMWNLVSIRWEPVSVQDRCMICAEHITGSKFILTHPIELLGDVGLVESHFGPFGDSVSVGANKVHDLRQM